MQIVVHKAKHMNMLASGVYVWCTRATYDPEYVKVICGSFGVIHLKILDSNATKIHGVLVRLTSEVSHNTMVSIWGHSVQFSNKPEMNGSFNNFPGLRIISGSVHFILFFKIQISVCKSSYMHLIMTVNLSQVDLALTW